MSDRQNSTFFDHPPSCQTKISDLPRFPTTPITSFQSRISPIFCPIVPLSNLRRKWPINKWDIGHDMTGMSDIHISVTFTTMITPTQNKIHLRNFPKTFSSDKGFSMTFSMAFFKTYFSLVSVQKSASRVSAATEATRVDKSNFFAIFVTLDISRFCQKQMILWSYPLKYLLACSSDLQFVFSLQ